MLKWIRSAVLIAVACLMLAGAQVVWAEDEGGGEGVTCCSSGDPCASGQACCRKKAPAAPCSPEVATQCVSNASECEGTDEN